MSLRCINSKSALLGHDLIQKQLCDYRSAYKDRPNIAIRRYLSMSHQEPLWIDTSLTHSRDFSPQHLTLPYPTSHAMEDIIYPTTVHILLSPSMTSCTVPKLSSSPLLPYYEVISRSKLWNSPKVRKPHFEYFNSSLSSLYAFDFKLELKFDPSCETPATCRHYVDSCQCDINAWRLDGGVWI